MNQKSLEFIQAIKDHADILSKYLEEHPEALARIVSELPTHQEPKKVTVEQELADAMFQEDVWNHPGTCAKAAIEFFQKRMPKPMPDNCSAPNTFWDGYNQSLKDVRQSLFGEA